MREASVQPLSGPKVYISISIKGIISTDGAHRHPSRDKALPLAAYNWATLDQAHSLHTVRATDRDRHINILASLTSLPLVATLALHSADGAL